jgi:hypothetical protein
MATSTQVQMQARCTAVLVTLTVKADANLSRVMALMPEEMRDTAKLYLDGKIVQWYSQVHGRGVELLFAAESAEQVERWTEPLPLVREKLVDLTFVPLGPLMPMWFLLRTPDPDGAPARGLDRRSNADG